MKELLDTIKTTRLVGQKLTGEHLAEITRMHADPQVMATLGGMRDEDQTRKNIEENVAHWNEHGFGLYVFHDPDSGTFVGRGGLRRVELDQFGSDSSRDETQNQTDTKEAAIKRGGEAGGDVEVAYALMPEYWGKGLATEMARALIEVGFSQLKLKELVAFALVHNHASRAVMEKCGFVYERDLLKANLPHALYRLLAA